MWKKKVSNLSSMFAKVHSCGNIPLSDRKKDIDVEHRGKTLNTVKSDLMLTK